MEINKTYYVKNLLLDGKQMTNDETCELLKLNDDGTCLVANNDGEIRLFRQDMLSEVPGEIYGELKTVKHEK